MLNNFDHQCSAPSVWDGTFERKVYFGVLVLLGEFNVPLASFRNQSRANAFHGIARTSNTIATNLACAVAIVAIWTFLLSDQHV